MNETIELKIEGMSCGHCVAGVTKALEGVSGVRTAEVRLEAGAATVSHDGSVAPEVLIAAVEEEGYDARLADA